MRNTIKICALAVAFSMLLCGCGEEDTEADKKIASLERELEKEKSKNAKEEKEAEQSSKTTGSREEESYSSPSSVQSVYDASSNSGKSEAADGQSSQNPFGDLSGNRSDYADYTDADVGDMIKFGHYEQDNDTSNGAEEIEWLVLAKEDDKMLVISQYALDCQPYNNEYTGVTWEVCTLRSWLNDSFYNKAFNGEEQAKILAVTNSNPDSYGFYNSDYAIDLWVKKRGYDEASVRSWGAKGGNATSDNVFCLSYEEALAYFASNEARECTPTAYAIEQGVWNKEYDNSVRCYWWLRSPGDYQGYAMYVYIDGSLGYYGVVNGISGVRPALWISTK